ncbi:MAG: M3 family metallopeptidase [Opitutales bacterium]
MQHPFLEDSFHIAWHRLAPGAVAPDIAQALAEAQRWIDEIAAQPLREVSFATTFGALEAATEELTRAWGYVEHLQSVNESPEFRAAYREMLPKVTDFFSRLPLNAALWERLCAFADSQEAKNLGPIDRRLVEEQLAEFREEGADLDDAAKARLSEINRELSSVAQQFSENVLDSTNAWECYIEDETRLSGLPQSVRDAAREEAAAKGRPEAWRFSLQAPSLLPVLRYADDDRLREEVWRAYTRVGWTEKHDNTPLVRRLLQLRQLKAELLGRAHFADLVTARRMARSGAQALGFVEDLHNRVKAPFAGEVQALRDFKAEATGTEPGLLQPWETSYWAEKRRRAEFDFDEEVVRQYFPIHQVIQGLFELAERLFDVRITERPTVFKNPQGEVQARQGEAVVEDAVEVWHPEVRFYELYDPRGEHLGSFFTDWHPRDSKRAGAWMNYLRTGGPRREGHQPHLGLICGNLAKPSGGKPALMSHVEVETIFHEFGHLLHHLLSRVPHPHLSGVNVVWDFVELPSQLLENWCWEPQALAFIAGHYETGEALPPELLEKMLAARNYLSASATMRQLSLAKLDLSLHLAAEEAAGAEDLEAWIQEQIRDYKAELATESPSLTRHFSHLFASPTGYAAGYYSYKWAEVLDADAFTRFQQEGVLNGETGKAFREAILEKGNSAPAEELFRTFMGRDPDPQALLRRSGLADAG